MSLEKSLKSLDAILAGRPAPEDIKQWRLARKLTQSELADKFGISVQTVQRWEYAQTPIPKWAELAIQTIALPAKAWSVVMVTPREGLMTHDDCRWANPESCAIRAHNLFPFARTYQDDILRALFIFI